MAKKTKGNNVLVIPFDSQKRTICVRYRHKPSLCRYFLKIPKGVFLIHYNKLTDEFKNFNGCYLKQSSESSYLFEEMRVAFCVNQKITNLENQTFYPALLGNIDDTFSVCLGDFNVTVVNADTPNVFIPKTFGRPTLIYASMIYDKLETLCNDAVNSYWSSVFNNITMLFNPIDYDFDLDNRGEHFLTEWSIVSKTNKDINEFLKEYPSIDAEMRKHKNLRQLSRFECTNYKTNGIKRMFLPYEILK